MVEIQKRKVNDNYFLMPTLQHWTNRGNNYMNQTKDRPTATNESLTMSFCVLI